LNEACRQASQRLKHGEIDAALELLRQSLSRQEIAAEDLAAAGSLIRGALEQHPDATHQLSVRLIGQCTTSWMIDVLMALAWRDGTGLRVSEAEYDTVIQDLLQLKTDRSDHPGVIVLIPWTQRLLGESGAADRSLDMRLADELEHWQQAWELIETIGSKLVQVGFDWVSTGGVGYHVAAQQAGTFDVIRRANAGLRKALPGDAYFVDLEAISGQMGRETFYDPRQYHWTKQPFSERGLALVCEHIWSGIRALHSGPKKVLVLDLDGTLWGGLVGELGPHGIALGETPEGEAFRSFQRYLKNLHQSGTLLAVCSKNNPDDAMEPFLSNPGMLLKREDFAAFEASWDPKVEALGRISGQLNLGLDSFVFFDDSPVEREQVRQMLPDVRVVEVPPDPADYVRALDDALCFERLALTAEDSRRTEQYQEEQQRTAQRQSAGTIEEYQQSLQMKATIVPIDESNMQRVVQLIGKTNQFNLTTRRHSTSEVLSLITRPHATSFCVQLQDRFGDYGLISVLIAVPQERGDGSTLEIDTWLMSCRAIGRTVEQAIFNVLIERATAQDVNRLVGVYRPTAKNAPVRDLYDRLGFRHGRDADDGTVIYTLDLPAAAPATTFVAIDS